MTDEKQADDQWRTALSEIFERPHMRLAEVEESLRSLNEAREDLEVYRNYFYLLAHLEFQEADAVRPPGWASRGPTTSPTGCARGSPSTSS